MKFDVHCGYFLQFPAKKLLPHTKQGFFLRKHLYTVVFFTAAVVLYIAAGYAAGFSHRHLSSGIPAGIYWLITHFFPTPSAYSAIPLILKTLAATAILAVTATVSAAFVALCGALIASRITGGRWIARLLITIPAAFLRNIPLPAWTILLLLSFRQNECTGFAALFLVTCGHLTRAFTEIIDEQSGQSFTALESAGASYPAVLIHGVLPAIMPLIVSWLLYAIETNIRDSALIGILTGTGIGFLFNLYFKSFRYNEAGVIIAVLMIMVLGIDALSHTLRRIML
ncbi:MAG: ABC transporter permease subunit [Treponema sp.]